MADDSRQRILDAAFAEFAANGKAGARMQAIAERAQANQALLNYYFNSKDDLYAAVIRQSVSELHSDLFCGEVGSWQETRKAWLDHIEHDLRFWAEHTELLRLTMHDLVAGGEGMRLALKEWMETPQACEMLDKVASTGFLRCRDPRQVVLHFMSLTMFYSLLDPVASEFWPSGKSRESHLEDRIKAVRDLLEAGLFAGGTGSASAS